MLTGRRRYRRVATLIRTKKTAQNTECNTSGPAADTDEKDGDGEEDEEHRHGQVRQTPEVGLVEGVAVQGHAELNVGADQPQLEGHHQHLVEGKAPGDQLAEAQRRTEHQCSVSVDKRLSHKWKVFHLTQLEVGIFVEVIGADVDHRLGHLHAVAKV